jgi:hypothetical protein
MDKVVRSAAEAVDDIAPGPTLAVGGFGAAVTARAKIWWIAASAALPWTPGAYLEAVRSLLEDEKEERRGLDA